MRVRRKVMVIIATVVAVAAFGTSAPAGADGYEDPFFMNWPTFVPSNDAGEYQVSSSNECQNGQLSCVDRVIRDMTKRYNALGCDHSSTFAFTYLLTTEEYRRAVQDPQFFTDNAFVNHQDAVFAEYYFDQFDDWRRGDLDEVSPAWRIAFDSADRQLVSGMGNVFLGMNAHVNRDLPFVLAEIGLVKPDGTSRKVDHDRVNDFLAATNQYLLVEAAKFLDPSLDDGDVPGISVDNSVAVQALVLWREQAWRNAERLVAAETQAEWDAVAQEIEQMAAFEALSIRTAFAYTPLHALLGKGASARNQFCASNFQAR